MPVNNNYEIKIYKGNSSGRIFNFPFRCFSLEHLYVEHIDQDGNITQLTQNTDYSVTGGLDNSGGMITYPLSAEVPALSETEILRIYRHTPMEQSIDYPTYQQAIENSFDKMTMLLQESIGSNAVQIASEAVAAAQQAVQDVSNKVDGDGTGITDRLAFLTKLGLGTSAEIDLSDLTLTDGSNANAEAFRTLVGVPEIESSLDNIEVEIGSYGSSILDIDSRVGLLEDATTPSAIRPQTIVQGAVGDIPEGWEEGWCDKPAEHLEVSTAGSATLIVKSGLQIAAGVEGATVLSNKTDVDSTLDLSGAEDGKYYIYADLDSNNDLSFGSTNFEPLLDTQVLTRATPFMTSNTSPYPWVVERDSVYNASLEAFYALNGINTNYANYRWQTPDSIPYPHYIRIGNPDVTMNLVGVRLTAYYYPPSKFRIKTSMDNENWTTQKEFTYTTWVAGTPVLFTFDEAVECKYVEIEGVERTISIPSSGYPNSMELSEIVFLEYSKGDLYDTSSHTHYNNEGNPIKRIYIGECEISSGSIVDVINYQHGTTITLPVNDGANLAVNSIYYLPKPYLGICMGDVRIYHQSKWGNPSWAYETGYSYGTKFNSTDGIYRVNTAKYALCTVTYWSGCDFTVETISAPARVTVERSW